MIPDYIIYEATEDIPNSNIKKGDQIISVRRVFESASVIYLQSWGTLKPDIFVDHYRSKCTILGSKGSNIPLSSIHPSILEFYQEQIGLQRHFTTKDIREVQDIFGTQYIVDSISRLSSNLHSISEVLSDTTIIPTIVGDIWNDFILTLVRSDQLGLIPAIIHELSKVTLISLQEVDTLEVSIPNSYELSFDIISKVGNIVILRLRFTSNLQ